MYRNCIFCSGDLGTNDAIESFPVGRAVAFDSARGRLWAVCPGCARWNLSPIEERWEPVEAAEKLFRDARLRVQSENVGLARLADGTSLIRVGDAVPGEMAAWRYGRQLLRRRLQYFREGAIGTAGVLAVYGGLNAVGVLGGGTMLWVAMMSAGQAWENRKIVHRLGSETTEKGEPLPIRRWHVAGMHLAARQGGGIELHIRDAHRQDGWLMGASVKKDSRDVVVVQDDVARSVLTRTMVHVNEKGATKKKLESATSVLERLGSSDELLRRSAELGVALGDRTDYRARFMGADALAFEMALNEENERRAMEGELAALEAAWREAEEIAAIADRLPFDLEIRWPRGRRSV